MPFDKSEVLFTDDDPEYRNTRLGSDIPPPSLATLPRATRNPRGDGGYGSAQRGRGQQRYQSNHTHSNQMYPNQMHPNQTYPNQMHSNQMHANQVNLSRIDLGQAQPKQIHPHGDAQRDQPAQNQTIDLVARLQSVVSSGRGPEFVEQLATREWSRMMSERDDVRGRRADARLCEIVLLQSIHACKETLQGVPQEQFESACRAIDPYAAVSLCALDNEASVVLGHLDFLLQPVREYVQPGRLMRYVDLGSRNRGFSHYIRWRVVQQTNSARAQGWYFAPSAAESDFKSIQDLSLFASAGGILDPSNIEKFVLKVRGDHADGVELVVAGFCPEHITDLNLDLEKQQYAYTIAQAAVALRVLQRGGTFVFKMFEASTPLSAELLFLIHACFERVAIVRSYVSRPTSSERFVVCNRLVVDPKWVASHLLATLAKMHAGQLKPSHLASWTRVSAEKRFMESIERSNMMIAQTQMKALNAVNAQTQRQQQNIAAYSKNQIESANSCLQHWGLPPTKPTAQN
ncbi:Cap-specific mRNA (nucleoside-2'-O-)-methyltransferase 1 [Coemansia sp. RSA 2618]|nr:Cap-specific mRNA (nucleoside-2'-O-)-methyltransferase 1 [Coemansia sp. RSA 2618]